MHTLKFKTNINCSGCINAVTPHLDNLEGIKSWQVDTVTPDKILTVETEENTPDEDKITRVVENAGFKISKLGS